MCQPTDLQHGVGMNYREVTGQMIELGVSLGEMAEYLGVSRSLLIQARMGPSASGSRNPPDGWLEGLEGLARQRGGKLTELADRLREAAGE